jgi:hypothetical protein
MRLDGERRKGYTFVDRKTASKARRRRRGVLLLVTIALGTVAGLMQLASAASDPPSTYSGTRLTAKQAAQYAYNAGFRTENQILAVVSIGIVESGLVTQARNWHPEFGYRPASDAIGVQGPGSVWSGNRQMHSDRGAWQISSRWWPQYTDAQADNPAAAAKAMYAISRNGTNFSLWDTYKSGEAQEYFDGAHGSWPALRPVVRAVIAAGGGTPAAAPAAKPKPTTTTKPKPTTTTTKPKPAAQPRATTPTQGSGSEVRLSGAYITGYSWYDNNPPGSAAISNPVIHQRAGGTGTFADPITVAINVPQFPWGTKFYIPNVRAYFIAEDTIGNGPSSPPHLDLWVGGQSSSESSADSCMSRITGNYLVIRNPASNYAVVPGPLSANNSCRSLFGNAVVTGGGAAVPNPPQPAPQQPKPKPPAVAPTQPKPPSNPPSTDYGSGGDNDGDSGHTWTDSDRDRDRDSGRHHHRRHRRHHVRWSSAQFCRR